MTLFWLELSKADRERTDAWLRTLADEETVDSLGLADILEKLSDLLYPATVTGMTRARYLLLVPLIYRYVARNPEADPLLQAKRLQARLATAIGGELGNIGIRAGEGLSRFPSSRYWNALNTLGILRRNVSEAEYLAAIFDTSRRELVDDDGLAHRASAPDTWWAPEAVTDVELRAGRFVRASLDLPPRERAYLRRRFLERAGGSYLAHCVADRDALHAEGPWKTRVPASLRACVDHARCFRAVLRVANLVYAWLVTETARVLLPRRGKVGETESAESQEIARLLERCMLAHRTRATSWAPAALLEMLGLAGHRAALQLAFLDDMRVALASSTGAMNLIARIRDRVEAREAEVRPSKRRLGPDARRDLLRQWDTSQHEDLYERSSRHLVARRIVNDLNGARAT